jgi:dTDP-4-amino-4,6-dideoxygalactose transaminase
LHMQTYYRQTFGYHPGDLPCAAAAYNRILSLPIFPSLKDEELDYTVDILRSVLKAHRR